MSFFNDRVRHAKAARLVNGEWKSSPKEMRIAAELHCADAVTEPGDEDDNFRCMDMVRRLYFIFVRLSVLFSIHCMTEYLTNKMSYNY